MLIKVRNADITNSEDIVIYGLNMEVEEGDFIYITGRVGTGKSSVFKTFMAQNPLASGECEVCGFNLKRIKSRNIPRLRLNLGVVFQDLQLLKDRDVHDNLDFVLRATGWKKKADREKRITEVLDQVGMVTKAHRFPQQLSGGEQQRICIARAILNYPKVILADEPTGNLDRETTESIMQLFGRINKEWNTAIIMITHDLSIIERHPGKVYHCDNETCSLCEETEDDTEREIQLPD